MKKPNSFICYWCAMKQLLSAEVFMKRQTAFLPEHPMEKKSIVLPLSVLACRKRLRMKVQIQHDVILQYILLLETQRASSKAVYAFRMSMEFKGSRAFFHPLFFFITVMSLSFHPSNLFLHQMDWAFKNRDYNKPLIKHYVNPQAFPR